MERNYGVDIAKIISMIMVVMLHVLTHSNLLSDVIYGSINYYIVWFIYAFALCAVNCFAISSGYIMIEKKFEYSQLIKLWFQVLFYSILLSFFIILFNTNEFNFSNIIRAFFPVLREQYWYVSIYMGMAIFIPFLNLFINSLDIKQLTRLVALLIVVFSFGTTISRIDVFKLNNGFSVMWLTILYIIGGWVKKSEVEKNLKKTTMFIYFIIMVLITWMSKIIIELFSMLLIGEKLSGKILFLYTSPTILFSALFLFLFCIKLKIRNSVLKKIIKKLITSNFSVYLMHDHLLVRKYVISNISLLFLFNYESIKVVPIVILLTLFIYVLCNLLDIIRVILFRKMHINEICNYLNKMIKNRITETTKIIYKKGCNNSWIKLNNMK